MRDHSTQCWWWAKRKPPTEETKEEESQYKNLTAQLKNRY